jgi:hypothetical protein
MTCKELQAEVLKDSLYPFLGAHGFRRSRDASWRWRGEFGEIIHLQNFSWNSKDSVDFCFNIGIAIRPTEPKQLNYDDLQVHLRQESFLPSGSAEMHRNKQGYSLNSKSAPTFGQSLLSDFRHHILPKLDALATLDAWEDFLDNAPFWKENLRSIRSGTSPNSM